MRLSKASQPDYKLADWFINRRPIYKPVRLTIGSQHIYKTYWHRVHTVTKPHCHNSKTTLSMDKRTSLLQVQQSNKLIRKCKITGSYKVPSVHFATHTIEHNYLLVAVHINP